MTTHTGSCHCGAVRFEIEADLSKGGSHCNCSICAKTAWFGLHLKPSQFRLLAGNADVTAYSWGGKISTRYFCRHCGVQCYATGHLEVLGGDFVSVNLNALDGIEVQQLPSGHWDGRHNNWQAGLRPAPWPILAEVR